MRFLPILLFLLSGCMVGPKYNPPVSVMPEKYANNGDQTTTDPFEWWKQFNDPVLDSFLDEAAKANYDIRIAVEKIVQARADYKKNWAYFWPQIDVNAVATRTQNSLDFFDPSVSIVQKYQNFFMLGFDAIWELDFFGKFRHMAKSAYDQMESTQADADNVMLFILSETAINYVNIRALQERISLIQEKIALDQLKLKLTADLFDSGLDSGIDVELILANLQQNESLLPDLETSLKQTIYGLAFLLGRGPETLTDQFKEKAPIPFGSGKVPTGLPSDLLRRRPDIRSVERQLAAATETVGAALADYFPHISLTGSNFSGGQLAGSMIGYQSAKLSHLFKNTSNTWSIGPSIFWNLIDFGRIRQAVNIQKSVAKQALLNYEKVVLTSLKDVERALVAYFQAGKKREILNVQVEANRLTLEYTQDQFEAGLTNIQKMIDAKQAWIDSKEQLTVSENALTADLIALYKALGGDWKCSYSH